MKKLCYTTMIAIFLLFNQMEYRIKQTKHIDMQGIMMVKGRLLPRGGTGFS